MKKLIILCLWALIFILAATGLTIIQLYFYTTATSFYLIHVSKVVFGKSMINTIFISAGTLSFSVTMLALARIYSIFQKKLKNHTLEKELNTSITQYFTRDEIFTRRTNIANTQSTKNTILNKLDLIHIKRNYIQYFLYAIFGLSISSLWAIQVSSYILGARHLITHKTTIDINTHTGYIVIIFSSALAVYVANLASAHTVNLLKKIVNKLDTAPTP